MNTLIFKNNNYKREAIHIAISLLLYLDSLLVILIIKDYVFTLIPLLVSLSLSGILLMYIQQTFNQKQDKKWIYLHTFIASIYSIWFTYPILIFLILKIMSLTKDKVILLFNYLLVVSFYTLYESASWLAIFDVFSLINLIILEIKSNNKLNKSTAMLSILLSPWAYIFLFEHSHYNHFIYLFMSIYVPLYVSLLFGRKKILTQAISIVLSTFLIYIFYLKMISPIDINFSSNHELIVMIITIIIVTIAFLSYVLFKTLMNISKIKFVDEIQLFETISIDIIDTTQYLIMFKIFNLITCLIKLILRTIIIKIRWVYTKSLNLSN